MKPSTGTDLPGVGWTVFVELVDVLGNDIVALPLSETEIRPDVDKERKK